MDPRSQIYFDKIVAKDPSELTRPERDFLRARRSYLKKSQLEEYQEIIDQKEDAVKVEDPPAPVVPDHLKTPEAPVVEVTSYNDLLKQARTLGYTGPRAKRGQLEQFIKDNTKK